nr:MAG TPA: hypothetical protein [Bacteriophage sp.]
MRLVYLVELISALSANQRGLFTIDELTRELNVDRIEYYSPYPIAG